MSETTRHAARDVAPVREAVLWAAWRVAALPALVAMLLGAAITGLATWSRPHLHDLVTYADTLWTRVVRRLDTRDYALPVAVTVLLILAVYSGLISR